MFYYKASFWLRATSGPSRITQLIPQGFSGVAKVTFNIAN